MYNEKENNNVTLKQVMQVLVTRKPFTVAIVATGTRKGVVKQFTIKMGGHFEGLSAYYNCPVFMIDWDNDTIYVCDK